MIKRINNLHYIAICDFCQEIFTVAGSSHWDFLVNLLREAGWMVYEHIRDDSMAASEIHCVCHKHQLHKTYNKDRMEEKK